jgi:hypothetical protein
MFSDLLFYLISEQLARAGAPGTRPEESEAILQEMETAIRAGAEQDAETRREGRHEGRSARMELDLVTEYLQTMPDVFSEEAHAWFLERAAREPDWERTAGPDAVVVRYITTADPLNRFLATAAQLAARPVDRDRPSRAGGAESRASVAPIAHALLELDTFALETGEPSSREAAEPSPDAPAGPSSRERADSIAELTDIVVDLSLSNLGRSRGALAELAALVREHPQVQRYDPVGRVLAARAAALGGEEASLLRSIAGVEGEERREEREEEEGEEL